MILSLLGLDIGTTGTKAIVFNLEGDIISQAYREYPLIYPQPGWIELDSVMVWEKVKEAIREAAAGVDTDPIRALSVSTQGEAFVPISKNGEILDNSIVTFDNRATKIAERLGEKLDKMRIFEITGMPLSGVHTLNKVIWLRENKPEVYNNTWKFLCYEDFAFYKMGLAPAIDYSLAARTMAFDVRKKEWSPEMLKIAEVDVSLFPEAKPSGEVVGKLSDSVAYELGLPKGVRAVTGGHDQPCGALGSGVIEESVAMDAMGTVDCITAALNKPVFSKEMLKNNHACYPHVVRDMYITLVFNFTGGSLLRWFRDTLAYEEVEEAKRTGKDVYDIITGKIKDGPSNLYILPHFTMTGTPYMDPDSKGAIMGLTLASDKADIIKAILEGITYEMKLNLEYLEQGGVKVEQLRAIGGGARSEKWLQLKADMFGRPIVSLNISEAACLGTVLLAGTAIGEYSSVSEAVDQVVKIKEIFEPDPEKKRIYDEKFRIYAEIYPTIKDLNHSI